MTRFASATWRPIPINFTRRGQTSVRGVVVHIMDGTLSGTDSWFRNPDARASSHFGTGRAGELYQWVSTGDRAWAQAGGNPSWLSVENEGRGGDELTSTQLDRNAQVLAWAHRVYGVPFKVAASTSDRGLAWHALGGSAWGGHSECPGKKVLAQLPEIVRRAKRIAAGTSGQLEPFPGAGFFTNGRRSPIIEAMGRRLVEEGCSRYAVGPGEVWTEADRKSYAAWQRKRGYSGNAADGIPGRTTWDLLRVPRS